MSKPLRAHPLAEQFPEMQGSEFDELVASIWAVGLKEPITLFEGMILDGRSRHRACIEAEVEPRFVEFTEDDPLKYVIEKNVLRRHLTPSQRAMLAAGLATAKRGRPQTNGSDLAPLAIPEAAKRLSVSEHSVKHAKTVLTKGIPDLQKAVQDRKVSVSAAAPIANLPKEKQPAQMAKAVTKKSRDERPPRFKSKRATSVANGMGSLYELTDEIKPADFVGDCPWKRRAYVLECVEELKLWCHEVEAELQPLSPEEFKAFMSEVAKLSLEDQKAILKAAVEARS